MQTGPAQPGVSRQIQASWGLPETFKTVGPFPFAGMNTQASRLAIGDAEFYWCENLIKVGDGKLRAVPDLGDPLYTKPAGTTRQIISFSWFNIGLTNYVAIFFDDGAGIQVDLDGTVTQIATFGSGVFYQADGSYPATVGWGGIYLLISNRNTSNDYWAWDGERLYGAGTVGPQITLTASGSTYVGQPTIQVLGGSGSGVVLEAEIDNGSVVALDVVQAGGGYRPGDTVQAVFSGGGGDDGAYLTVQLDPTEVNQVVVLAAGFGFTSPPTVGFTGGGGTGAAATATLDGNGGIDSVTVTSPGSGYTSAPTVSFTGGGGSGAQAQATLVNSAVDTVTVVLPGTNFYGVPLLEFRGGFGSGASATAVLSGPGPIVSITIPPGQGGTGYTTIPAVTITDAGAGSGAAADAVLVGDVVDHVDVTAGGSGYTAPPTVTISGDGTGATAHATIAGDAVDAVIVDAGGSGYSAATVSFTPAAGGGTGAEAIVDSAVGGVLQSILVTEPGEGYTSPVVTIDPPASGTTATATAAVGAGSIVSVTVDNKGAGYTAAPAIIVEPGLNGAASAVLELWPFGVSGDSIETYQSQVWLQNPHQSGETPTGGVRLSSAPSSITDFSTSGGGLEETVTDRFLRRRLRAIRQSNGFLYPIGDSSVGVISNVKVEGNPPTKSLTSNNTDPQTGTNWRDSVQDFSRTILFGNKFGIFGLFGGAVTKISAPMDGVFEKALLPEGDVPQPVQPITPTAAVANLYNRKVYLLLISMYDPFTGTYRPAMVAWNEKDWSIISQSVGLSYIGTQEIDSNLTAWGTDGNSLWPLMQTPSTSISKILATKLWGADRAYLTKLARMVYAQAENVADPDRAPVLSVTIDTEYASFPAQIPTLVYPAPGTTLPTSAARAPFEAPLLAARAGDDISAQLLGLTIRSAEPDFELNNLILATEDVGPIFG